MKVPAIFLMVVVLSTAHITCSIFAGLHDIYKDIHAMLGTEKVVIKQRKESQAVVTENGHELVLNTLQASNYNYYDAFKNQDKKISGIRIIGNIGKLSPIAEGTEVFRVLTMIEAEMQFNTLTLENIDINGIDTKIQMKWIVDVILESCNSHDSVDQSVLSSFLKIFPNLESLKLKDSSIITAKDLVFTLSTLQFLEITNSLDSSFSDNFLAGLSACQLKSLYLRNSKVTSLTWLPKLCERAAFKEVFIQGESTLGQSIQFSADLFKKSELHVFVLSTEPAMDSTTVGSLITALNNCQYMRVSNINGHIATHNTRKNILLTQSDFTFQSCLYPKLSLGAGDSPHQPVLKSPKPTKPFTATPTVSQAHKAQSTPASSNEEPATIHAAQVLSHPERTQSLVQTKPAEEPHTPTLPAPPAPPALTPATPILSLATHQSTHSTQSTHPTHSTHPTQSAQATQPLHATHSFSEISLTSSSGSVTPPLQAGHPPSTKQPQLTHQPVPPPHASELHHPSHSSQLHQPYYTPQPLHASQPSEPLQPSYTSQPLHASPPPEPLQPSEPLQSPESLKLSESSTHTSSGSSNYETPTGSSAELVNEHSTATLTSAQGSTGMNSPPPTSATKQTPGEPLIAPPHTV